MARKMTGEKLEAERQRLKAMREYEDAYGACTYLCGVDEAGRGPLAGDVYAAAVILPQGLEIPGIDDSKKLSAKKREQLYEQICAQAVACCISSATVEEIDRLNILRATCLAMNRAYAAMLEQGLPGELLPALALVDGNRDKGKSFALKTAHELIVKGDSLSVSIAAASVLAKVSRDRFMLELAREYPQYGFEAHKGYGTKLHYTRLREFGPSPVHRRSFLKKL